MGTYEWVSSFLTAHQHIEGHFSAMMGTYEDGLKIATVQ